MFNRLTPAEVLAKVASFWDLSKVLPLPKVPLVCPVCWACSEAMPPLMVGKVQDGELKSLISRGSSWKVGPLIRHWKFHRREIDTPLPWRCDLSLKCCACSHVWVHGLALDAVYWARAIRAARCHLKKPGQPITWRQGKHMLEAEALGCDESRRVEKQLAIIPELKIHLSVNEQAKAALAAVEKKGVKGSKYERLAFAIWECLEDKPKQYNVSLYVFERIVQMVFEPDSAKLLEMVKEISGAAVGLPKGADSAAHVIIELAGKCREILEESPDAPRG